jgi:hypothetical protein
MCFSPSKVYKMVFLEGFEWFYGSRVLLTECVEFEATPIPVDYIYTCFTIMHQSIT